MGAYPVCRLERKFLGGRIVLVFREDKDLNLFTFVIKLDFKFLEVLKRIYPFQLN